MKAGLAQAEAIVRLAALPEWGLFMSMIAVRAEQLNELLIMKDDVNVDLTRGELRAFVRLTDAITNAPAVINQHNTPKT